MVNTASGAVLGISHLQLNCADIRRSVAFYRLLNFHVERIIGEDPAQPADPGNPDTWPLVKSEAGSCYTVGMRISEDPRATTRIELMEWVEPKRKSVNIPPMERLAVARIALTVKGLDQIMVRLEAAGERTTDPEGFTISQSLSSRFTHLFDPDGNQLTLTEWIKS